MIVGLTKRMFQRRGKDTREKNLADMNINSRSFVMKSTRAMHIGDSQTCSYLEDSDTELSHSTASSRSTTSYRSECKTSDPGKSGELAAIAAAAVRAVRERDAVEAEKCLREVLKTVHGDSFLVCQLREIALEKFMAR